MKNIHLLFFLITSYLLTSCNTSSKYNEIMKPIMIEKMKEKEPRIVDGKPEPDFPDWDLNNSTIEGIDSDKNGVRDDVDIWINRVGVDFTHRELLRKLARATNKVLVTGEGSTTAITTEVISIKDFRLSCLRDYEIDIGIYVKFNFDDSNGMKLYELYFHSTADRRKQLKKHHDHNYVTNTIHKNCNE